jgi:VCBS repeat-containing protein
VLVVNFDASVQPATQQGEFGRIRVKVDGTWRVSADVRTTLIP